MAQPHIVKSLFWLTFSEILFNLSGYIIHAVAGRVLGPADYGRYSLVITLTTVVIILIGNGIPTAMSKYLSEAFEKDPRMVLAIKRESIRTQTLLMGAVTILFYLAAPMIARALQDPTLTPLFRFSALIIPAFAASSFYFYYFTGLHLFHYQSILKSFRSLMRIAVTVSLVIYFGLNGAILGYILAPLATFLLGLYLDAKIYRKEYAGFDNIPVFPWQKLLAYAWPVTLFMLFYELFSSIDLYLVKALMRNDTATGLYNAALTIGRIPYYLFYALSILLLPALAKMNSEQNKEEMKKLMTQSLRYAGMILLPTFIFLFAYATPITTLFFGQKYANAAPSLQILVFGLSWLTVFYLIASALNGIGQARLSMWLAIIGTIANTILNVIFIKRYGIIGAAIATTIGATLTALVSLGISQRLIPVHFHWMNILKTLLVGVLLWFGTTLLPANNWLFIPYSLILGTLYLFTLKILNVLTQEDIARFAKISGKRAKA